jgi:hypothetical protein
MSIIVLDGPKKIARTEQSIAQWFAPLFSLTSNFFPPSPYEYKSSNQRRFRQIRAG